MSTDRIKTKPSLMEDSPKHIAALTKDSDHLTSWQYNVADKFKGQTVENIKTSLQETAFPYAVCMEHLVGDFNFATVVRNANAFNAQKVFYIGDKRWDKRGAVGTYNYIDVEFIPTIDALIDLKNKYTFVGIDNVPGSIMMNDYSWKKDSLIIIGEEGVGLTNKMQSLCEAIVEIPMFGSVRSLNAGTASGIIMHDFISRINK
jgi:tRNA G18 (ribose-2'-O)-methylase SpoU